MNIIFGTDDGQFVVTFMLRPKPVKKKFPAAKPKLVLPWIEEMVKRHGKIDHAMSSSSMDFPEENDVTRKQVSALYKTLGME